MFYKTKKVICGLVGCFFMFISVAHADNIAANLKESKAETTTVSTSIDPNRMLNILIVSSVCLGITLWGSLLIGGAALIGLGIGASRDTKTAAGAYQGTLTGAIIGVILAIFVVVTS